MNRRSLLGIICTLLALGSCTISSVVFDENLPSEKSACLYIWYGLNITEYNGIAIPQKQLLFGKDSTWVGKNVYLPPGEMEFKTNVNFSNGNYHWVADDVYFRYKFEEGKQYTLLFTNYGGADHKWGVDIFDGPPPGAGYPRKDKLVAFSPFYKYKEE
ncbi:MAG: hypothetical protein LBU85_02270 [Treponema sp.]|nr:hypothetical protein [Treponema sp.]